MAILRHDRPVSDNNALCSRAARARRFWAKVQRPITVDGCWLWTGATFARGYGMFNAGRGPNGEQNTRYAHRFAYTLVNGPIPDGLYVCHTCDTPRCCNPRHLFLGTQDDNIKDAIRKGRKVGRTRSVKAGLPAGTVERRRA